MTEYELTETNNNLNITRTVEGHNTLADARKALKEHLLALTDTERGVFTYTIHRVTIETVTY